MLGIVVRLLRGIGLVLCLVLAPAALSAQASPDYDAAVKLGFEEFTLGNYVEARARFGEAHKLYPNARTLRALGMVEYELKRYVASIEFLQQALASRERALTDEQRAQTEKLLGQAGGYVARFRFAVTPSNASLSLDGVPVSLDLERGVLLAAGEHVIEVSADKHETVRRTVQVLGGEEDRKLAIALPVEAQLATKSAAPARDQPMSAGKKAAIWGTVAAVVLGGAVAGLVIGLRKDSGEHELNTGTTMTEVTVPGMALVRR